MGLPGARRRDKGQVGTEWGFPVPAAGEKATGGHGFYIPDPTGTLPQYTKKTDA